MTTRPPFGPDPGSSAGPDPGVPADVAALAAALDRLAAAERAAPGSSFEDRLLLATRSALPGGAAADIAGLGNSLDQLARIEQAAAPASLEDRLVLATSGILRGVGRPAPATLRVTVRWHRWAARLAALLTLTAGGLTWWTMTRTPAVQPPLHPLDDHTLALVERDLSDLTHLASSTSATDTFDDLHRELDSLDQSVKGNWFRIETVSSDEEPL